MLDCDWSSDVCSSDLFDGRRVLIPSGSRLIGQYRSGLAAGQSRAFIVWTRLTRPDGVTVSLGSPVTDPLGRAGLGGKVDSHFLKRFGSAILLSVVQSGLGLLQRGGNDVVVRTADDAKSVAGIALQRDISIPPTVKVAQGTAIRIFIARDLDFSGTDGGS
jgi:type IV secretion system protein VirB10